MCIREWVYMFVYRCMYIYVFLGKSMNPIILPPATSKYKGRLGSSALVRQLVKEKQTEFKPVKLRLKVDLVSYPAREEGLVCVYVYIYIYIYICMYEHLWVYVYVYIYTSMCICIYQRLCHGQDAIQGQFFSEVKQV